MSRCIHVPHGGAHMQSASKRVGYMCVRLVIDALGHSRESSLCWWSVVQDAGASEQTHMTNGAI